MFTPLIVLAALAGSFYVGACYGRGAEAKAIALALRIESYSKQELVDVIAKVRSVATVKLARLKRYL